MAIQYPVDVVNSRWAVLQVSTGQIVARDRTWPRGDGEAIQGQDPDYVYLRQLSTSPPDYDSRLFVLVGNEEVDADANEIRRTWEARERDLAERTTAVDNEESFRFTNHFPIERISLETAIVVGVLIQFAVDGQAIPPKWKTVINSYRDKVRDKLLPNRDRRNAIVAALTAGQSADLDAGWSSDG